jgi:hypothetical protein
MNGEVSIRSQVTRCVRSRKRTTIDEVPATAKMFHPACIGTSMSFGDLDSGALALTRLTVRCHGDLGHVHVKPPSGTLGRQ